MPTFKPIVVLSNKRKDGTWAVVIRITHKGKVRRIITNLVCHPSDITRSGRIKNQDIISKGNTLCDKMRNALDGISPFVLDAWDVDRVVRQIRGVVEGESFRLDFFTFGREYASRKRPETGKTYIGALNAFARFLGSSTLDINAITKQMILEFIEFNENENKMHKSGKNTGKKKVPGSSARRVSKLANIYQAAKDQFNDEDSGRIPIPKSPFSKVPRTQPQSHGQKALPVDVLRRILSAEPSGSMEAAALAAFSLSLLTMGANLADLFRAKPFEGNVWHYNRKKTELRRADHSPMQVKIPKEAKPYIATLKDGPEGWWLPALHRLGKDGDTCTHIVNKALKGWAERNGIPTFTFYAARHSWATIARRLGVEKATVDECLCHKGDYDLTDIYAERAWGLLDAANRKVVKHLMKG